MGYIYAKHTTAGGVHLTHNNQEIYLDTTLRSEFTNKPLQVTNMQHNESMQAANKCQITNTEINN